MASFKRNIYGLPFMAAYRAWRTHCLMARSVTTPHDFTFSSYAGFGVGDWEEHERRLMAALLPLCDRLIDIGANHGFYSLLAAKLGVPAVAVEPDANNIHLLRHNVRANHAAVTIVPAAIADTIGTIDLYGDGDMASVHRQWQGTASYFRRTVASTTVDALADDISNGERILIKIDVEGAEDAVILGATRTLGRTPRPIWLIESYPRYPDGGRSGAFQTLFDAMFTAGYAVMTVEREPRRLDAAAVRRWNRDPLLDSNFLFFAPEDAALVAPFLGV